MSGETLRCVVLAGTTLATGLVAGTFALYAHTIMPALRTTDDRTFVGTFQALDRAILNPWFLGGGFIGALMFGIASVVVASSGPSFPWALAALASYVAGVIVTLAVHVPLNDAIKAAGDPARIADLGEVRRQFHESRWAAWNLVRTLTATSSFVCSTWALTLVRLTSP